MKTITIERGGVDNDVTTNLNNKNNNNNDNDNKYNNYQTASINE